MPLREGASPTQAAPQSDDAAPATRGPAPRAMHRAGQAAVQRMSVDPKEAQQSFQSASLEATATKGATLSQTADATVTLAPGADLIATVDNEVIYFSARPGLRVSPRLWGFSLPDVMVTGVLYDFATAKFQVQTDQLIPIDLGVAKFDAGAFETGAVASKLEAALDTTLRPMLPSKMAHPGYTIHGDPDIEGTLAQLSATVGKVSSKSPHAAGGPGVENVQATVTIEAPRDVVVPLVKGYAGTLKAGTRLTLIGKTVGVPPHLTLDQVEIDIDQPGFELAAEGNGVAHELASVDLRRMTITRGGHFTFDYDLGAEQFLQGLLLVGQMTGAAAQGQQVDEGSMPLVHIDSVHKRVDDLLQSKFPPAIEQILRAHDGAIPGVSLSSLFGATPKPKV